MLQQQKRLFFPDTCRSPPHIGMHGRHAGHHSLAFVNADTCNKPADVHPSTYRSSVSSPPHRLQVAGKHLVCLEVLSTAAVVHLKRVTISTRSQLFCVLYHAHLCSLLHEILPGYVLLNLGLENYLHINKVACTSVWANHAGRTFLPPKV